MIGVCNWRRLHRQLVRLALLAVALFIFVLTLLPYSNHHRVFVLHHLNRLVSSDSKLIDHWLTQTPATQTVNWKEDVGIILKSGFGTQHRIPAWLEGTRNADDDLVLIADFATGPDEHLTHQGRELPVHDVIGSMVKEGSLAGSELKKRRVQQYMDLNAAIQAGDLDKALGFSKKFGWELDAMKFISGLELAYQKMPHKKWYLFLDDDTYIIQSSLTLLLGRLDPDDKHYVGNAIGGYYGRFGHGGSGIVLSRGAVRHLYSPQNSEIVMAAKKESVTEPLGDRMLALALLRVGITIDETYSRYFNGERPIITKIRPDRFCAPIFTFHGHKKPEDMRTTGEIFRNTIQWVRWLDVWGIYRAPPLESWADTPMRQGWDHVGRLDEYTLTVWDVQEVTSCQELCLRRAKTCLAWTWLEEREECHLSPWMIVGDAGAGRISGINSGLARELAAKCN